MAAPADSARQGTNITTAAATWNVNVGSPSAGTLLIVFIRTAAASGGATFTGYSALVDNDVSDATDDSTFVYYRWADGTEGATDVWDPVNSVKGGAICWEVTGAANEAPALSTVNTGTTTANTATSNSVAPTGAPQDTLYITMAGGDGELSYTNFPTNYANLTTANSGTTGGVATNCFMGGASRQITASSSDDAGTFTHGAHSNGWTAFAVAIRPPPPPYVPRLIRRRYPGLR